MRFTIYAEKLEIEHYIYNYHQVEDVVVMDRKNE